MNEDLELVRGSGNVWNDFGYPDADIRQAKTCIASQIIETLNGDKLSTHDAAKRTGFDAADFSRVRNADLERFTLDRLIHMLHALNRELQVAVTIQPRN